MARRARIRGTSADRNAPVLRLNPLDRLVGYFAPVRGLRRAQARMASAIIATRRYEGASRGRRTEGWVTSGASANAEIGPALNRLRARSRDLVRNNPFASSAVEKMVSNIIGNGITPRARTGQKGRDSEIDALWADWAEVCDADGCLNFAGLQSLAARTTVESGECLVLMRNRRPEDGLPIPLQLQLLEPDHLDTAKNATTKTGVIVNGVEFDLLGRRIAYWLFPTHPGDGLWGGSSVRFSSQNILHLYRKTRPGQVRAAPWLAAIILRLRDLDEYADAELWRKKVAACFAAFVTRPEGMEGTPMGVGQTTKDGTRTDSIEPGMIEYLSNGEHVEFSTPRDSGGYDAYMRTELHGVAAGIGVTYEQMTGDLSQVNFSSLRHGLQEFRRWAGAVTTHVIGAGFNTPIWRRAMTLAQVAGTLSQGATAAQWTPQRWPFIEPLKDAQADILLARAGFETVPQIMQRYGHSAEDQLDEIEEFAKELDDRELVLDTDPRRVSRGGQYQVSPDGSTPGQSGAGE